jgi:hypothetical protein
MLLTKPLCTREGVPSEFRRMRCVYPRICRRRGSHLTCFTSTKVQILTPATQESATLPCTHTFHMHCILRWVWQVSVLSLSLTHTHTSTTEVCSSTNIHPDTQTQIHTYIHTYIIKESGSARTAPSIAICTLTHTHTHTHTQFLSLFLSPTPTPTPTHPHPKIGRALTARCAATISRATTILHRPPQLLPPPQVYEALYMHIYKAVYMHIYLSRDNNPTSPPSASSATASPSGT